MAHTISLLDLDRAPEEGPIPIASCQTFADWAQAQAYALDLFDTHGVFAVAVGPDPDLFADLGSYIAALNLSGTWLQANPIPGAWISTFTADLDHWAGAGITHPRDLAASIDVCFARAVEKSAWA